jgi:hypothetical protein
MKIVFVGNHQVSYSSETHHCKTLESMGHEVIRLQEGEVDGDVILEYSLQSDMLVFIHTHGWVTNGYPLELVFKSLKAKNIPTVTYHLDLWFGLERQKDLDNDPFYHTIEHFFATDKLMADWFNCNTNVKGHFLPAGVYDEECYLHNDYNNDFEHDVIFVGSKGYHPEYPYRPILIDFLRAMYKDKFLHVGGDGDTGTIRGDDLNRIYAKSKIAVGDTLNIDFTYPYYSSDRLFESTGRGGFTIYPKIKGLDKYFKDKKEIVFYKHGDLIDLKNKIDYYLDNTNEREAIRLAGHNRTRKEHTYVNRWQGILEVINASNKA